MWVAPAIGQPIDAQPANEPRMDPSTRRVSLGEALRLFRSNNLSLRRAQAQVTAQRGEARQTAAYPNPQLQASYEPIWRNGTRRSEAYVTLSQRIARSGRRYRIDAARARVGAVQARTQADRLRLTFEVAAAYVRAATAEARVRQFSRVARVFRSADSSFAAREAAGEASGYAVRRIRLERARYEQRLATARRNVLTARRHLALLIVPEGAPSVAVKRLPQALPPPVTEDEALRVALRQRPELRRWQSRVDAQRAALQAARHAVGPSPTVTAGYKDQSDGFVGVFLGVSLPLPLFNRHHGQAAAASARLSATQTTQMLVRREIKNDVRQAHSAYASLRRQIQPMNQHLLSGAGDLLEIAQTSYAEGEMSLLELLDATEAYHDAQIRTVNMRADLWTRYFDVLRAMGHPLRMP
ncbi:TolC family protein [Salisaeta longa]|uniref:TolC family protein n=1 Tax=Salisaeta longa TaxID=503170 RepID=UPI0003B3EBDF|nr:TolC family protein [Salisaeta longa]